MAPPSSTYPGPHPDPPADFSTTSLPIVLNQGSWYRLHRSEHTPLYFGRTGFNRFDAPDGEFGVLYLGDSPKCCFVETYGRSDRDDHRIVTRQELTTRNLATVEFSRPLRVVDLTGSGLARIGVDNRLGTGDYRIARRWSQALWAHPDEPDGILYRSRHDPSRTCLAIFDRATDALAASNVGSLVERANLALLAAILDAYDIGYLE